MKEVMAEYEKRIAPARKKFDRRVADLLQDQYPLRRLFFLLYYCALGIAMTEKVVDWIQRAGRRCQALRFSKLGEALTRHAKEEEGHELLMRNDVSSLIDFIADRHHLTLDPESFLNQPLTAGVLCYRQLHEDCMAGHAPYGQAAIEFEIEQVSIVYGPSLIRQCLQTYGTEFLRCLSFVDLHVRSDVSHTEYNQKILRDFLNDFPETLPALVDWGAKAIDAYGDYLLDCHRLASDFFSLHRGCITR